jgi:hypothetical protein
VGLIIHEQHDVIAEAFMTGLPHCQEAKQDVDPT